MSDLTCEICGAKVTQWSARFDADVTHCKSCFKTPAAKAFIANKYSENPQPLNTVSSENNSSEDEYRKSLLSLNEASQDDDVAHSFLSQLLYVLAGLSLFGGFILCTILWPNDANGRAAGNSFLYIPAISVITASIVQFSLFAALGQGLHYLKKIASNTRRIRNESIAKNLTQG